MKLKPYYKIPPKEWLCTSNGDVAAAKRKAVAEKNKDERQIEEYVRQWVLSELCDSYNYPSDWLGEKMLLPVMQILIKRNVSLKHICQVPIRQL